MSAPHFELQRFILNELEPGESVAWSGAPRAGRKMLHALPIVLFGIPWTAFAVFWIAGASGFKMPDFSSPMAFFPLFGVPFVLIGLGMLSAPVWVWLAAKKTGYFITNRRAIIVQPQGFGGLKIRSFAPQDLQRIDRTQFSDGSGDVIFCREEREVSTRRGTTTRTHDLGFLGIPDAATVERMLRALAGMAG